jgi:carbonic anhydrase
MHHLDLTSIIDSKKTLIITCVECNIAADREDKEQVFVYTSLGTVLYFQDPLLKENLRYYICHKDCTQIIIAGHLQCKALDYLMTSKSQEPKIKSLKGALRNLSAQTFTNLHAKHLHERMLVESNVTRQAEQLLTYDFIDQKVKQKNLSVIGVVAADNSKFLNTIFLNGISLNRLTTMS